MIQVEGTRMTPEDKRELERNIKEFEKKLESGNYYLFKDRLSDIKELRRLRRMRE